MSEFDGEWTKHRPDGWEDEGETVLATQPEQRSRRHRLIDAGAIIGVVALTAAIAVGAYHNRKNITQSPKREPEAFALTTACPTPSQTEVSAVERLFSEPVIKAREQYRQRGLTAYGREGSLTVTNLFGSRAPEILYYEGDYFKHYGIDVEFASQADQTDGVLRPPTTSEIDSDSASVNLEGIMAGLSEVPAHYVIMSGLKTIRLMVGDQNTSFVWEDSHTLDWNINVSYPNPDPVPQEVGIALGGFSENRLCGPDGTENDTALAAVAQGPFPGLESMPGQHLATLDDYEYRHAPADEVKVWDTWSAENVYNDKASLLSVIASPGEVASVMSPDHPILRAKEIEVLAELYHRQPAVVRRLAVKADTLPMFGPDHNTPAGTRRDIPFTEWAKENHLVDFKSGN